MNKLRLDIKVATTICITIIIFSICFYPTLYRYEKIKYNNSEVIVKINRVTGKTLYFNKNTWHEAKNEFSQAINIDNSIKHKDNQVDKQNIKQTNKNIVELPKEEIKKINGSFKFFGNEFLGNIYNGTDNWIITKIIIRIIVKKEDGTIRWDNKYSYEFTINELKPMEADDILIKTIGKSKNDTFEFNIETVYGYKDN
ncbi:MAG: hypothetical protein PWP27_165 [Clostridiales bacterium]|jgi:hypothetical protein|nr:hypothetical protein [Clostridiales bacterium]